MDLLHDTNLWLGISFAIFAFILWRKGKDGFLAMLDRRILAIRKEIEMAETLRIEAQELLAQYQRKHRDSVKEAAQIMSSAEKHATEIRRKAQADLDEAIERRERQLTERIERMKQSAIAEIQQYATDLAIIATAEIIAEKLDKKANENLIDQAIKDVGGKLH